MSFWGESVLSLEHEYYRKSLQFLLLIHFFFHSVPIIHSVFLFAGYSVTAGRFFGNYMSYVGGAPRAKETGQVVFFTREKIGESLLRVDLILDGEMFASSFGFEVLGIDINNDG